MTLAKIRSTLRAGAAVLALCAAAPLGAGAAGSGGYVVFDSLTETYQASGNLIVLSGTLTNECAASLPPGSALVFEFDKVVFAGFTLTALGNGSQQNFSAYGSLPLNLPPPAKNTTSLGFAIVLPKGLAPLGEAKTSTCLVTLAPGTPPVR